MSLLRRLLDAQGRLIGRRGRWSRLHPVHEACEHFCYGDDGPPLGAPLVRDVVDTKRLMFTVVIALVPALLMALWNTGYQIHGAVAAGASLRTGWQTTVFLGLGLEADPAGFWACLIHGGLYFLPVAAVSFAVGGLWEVLFAVVRRHPISEGFLVTGLLFPLILPPTVPLWGVALGISFAVVLGKEVFGGTGYNIANPALLGRCYLFFAHPQWFSGPGPFVAVDGYSAATPLSAAVLAGADGRAPGLAALAELSWVEAFLGTIPGAMGETSTLACLLGAVILLGTGVASWRIMVAAGLGTSVTVLLFNALASDGSNAALALPLWWHLVLGGWAFGIVFMATDPVSAPITNAGRWLYGFLIGAIIVLIRCLNPVYGEGVMLAILLMNVFAPLIDHGVIAVHIAGRRRRVRIISSSDRDDRDRSV